MSKHDIEIDSETSRIRAVLVNSGLSSFEKAEEKLATSALSIMIDVEAARTPAGQAAFLTAAVTGGRCFGSVTIHGAVDEPFRLPLPVAAKHSPKEQSSSAHGERTARPPPGPFSSAAMLQPTKAGVAVRFGTAGRRASPPPQHPPEQAAVTLHSRAWCPERSPSAKHFSPSKAISAAGRSTQILSLWLPDAGEQGALNPGPAWGEVRLPPGLWLVGLGNLGQAFLWSLMTLPYATPEKVLLFLQDDQCVGKENWGTSVLVERGRYGILKTRVAEDWALRRGFQARRIDRRLDKHLFRLPQEPGIALAGLDRMPVRRLLGGRVFEYVVDTDLGATVADYRKFRLNVFDASGNPADHFAGVEDQTAQVIHDLMQLPAYKGLAKTRGDGGFGAATLAGSSVPVPFVSAFAGALSITQAVRIASCEPQHLGIAGETGDLRSVHAALGAAPERIVVDNLRAAS